MIRRNAIILSAALLLAPLTGVGIGYAHQQKIAISTIALNPRSGTIEIVHQVPVHDAEHALRYQGANNPDIIGSADSREAFARYVTRRFLLEVDGAAVQPAYVGSEIGSGSLFVYQEAPAPKDGTAMLRFNSQILTDLWARQENRVNIGAGTKVNTVIFHAGDAPAEAPLTR